MEFSQAGEQILITNKDNHNSGLGFAFSIDSTGRGLKGYLGTYSETHSNNVKRAEASNTGIDDGNWQQIAKTVAFSNATMTLLIVDGILLRKRTQLTLTGI